MGPDLNGLHYKGSMNHVKLSDEVALNLIKGWSPFCNLNMVNVINPWHQYYLVYVT